MPVKTLGRERTRAAPAGSTIHSRLHYTCGSRDGAAPGAPRVAVPSTCPIPGAPLTASTPSRSSAPRCVAIGTNMRDPAAAVATGGGLWHLLCVTALSLPQEVVPAATSPALARSSKPSRGPRAPHETFLGVFRMHWRPAIAAPFAWQSAALPGCATTRRSTLRLTRGVPGEDFSCDHPAFHPTSLVRAIIRDH